VDCVSWKLSLPVHPQAGSATLDANAQHYLQNVVLAQVHICSLRFPATVQITLSVETVGLNPSPRSLSGAMDCVHLSLLSTLSCSARLQKCRTLAPNSLQSRAGERQDNVTIFFNKRKKMKVSSSSQLFTRTDFDASTFRARHSAIPLHQQRGCAACAAAGTRRAQAAAPRCRRRPRRLRRLHAASCPRLPLPSPRCRAAAGP